MSIILITLINASIFSIGGLGEDMSVFRIPFINIRERAQIEFTLKPEFNILNEGRDLRGIFWTNPFNFNLTVPITKGFVFGLGNLERFNQSFDVYMIQDELEMHLSGEGGVEEIYANLNNDFGAGEIAFRGSYLFGNASELWDYYIANYNLVDTFLYKYRGKIFCGGVKFKFVSVFYECLGDIVMEKQNSDTTIELPSKLSIGLNPELNGWETNLLFEHSFWSGDNYRSPNRFKISFTKKRVTVGYMFNPWYLGNIMEHGLDLSLNIPIHRLGSITLNFGCALKNKDSLREIDISPEIKLTIQEIFARRK